MPLRFLPFLIVFLVPFSVWGQGTSAYIAESEGLDLPVVYTIDPADPVLYRIRCAGKDSYIKAANYRTTGWGTSKTIYALTQVSRLDGATDFYFVKRSGGVDVYTSDGYYVVASSTSNGYRDPVSLTKGSVPADCPAWTFSYTNEDQAPGYIVGFTTKENLNGTYFDADYYWSHSNPSIVTYGWPDEDGTFLFYSADPRHRAYLEANGVDGSDTPRGDLSSLVGTISLDGRPLVYDASSQTYLYSLPESLRGGGEFVARCTYADGAGAYTLNIGGNDVAPDADLSLAIADPSHAGTVTVKDAAGKNVLRAKLAFTFLPIVEIGLNYCEHEKYSLGTLRVNYDPALDDDDDESGNAQQLSAVFKYRGATASGLAKKSFAVKLRERNGIDYDRKFFGLRNDNNWILDAAGIDPSLMRNRVATDLWNDFSHKPYYKAEVKNERTGTRGRFVEVVYNGEYLGLYCMTEKMDRKQAKAMKQEKGPNGSVIQHGSVYKSTEWKYETFMGHDIDVREYPRREPEDYEPYNTMGAGTWRGWEIKYPDYERQPIDWGPLYNCVSFTAMQAGTNFYNGFNTYWDLDQVKDYYLLLELLLATDNHGKNMFLINYDQQAATDAQRMAIGVWDLDGIFGIRWDGSTKYTQPDQDFEKFLWAYEHGTHLLFYRLKMSKNFSWANVLAARYAKLRHGDFDPENLKRRFTDYLALISESGADAREAKRWGRTAFKYAYHDDIEGAVRYACDWIDRRVAYLDKQYSYDPDVDPDILDNLDAPAVTKDEIAVRPGRGELTVWADAPTELSIYTAAGQLVATRSISSGLTTIAPLSAGIYLVAGRKVVVK